MLCGMRVIAGTHRGRRLQGPQGLALRPTSDRVREALFSILGNRLPGCRFLDLYAGTGAIGIEAISRGAQHVTCVESNEQANRLLHLNMSDCGMSAHMTILHQTVKRFLSQPDRWSSPFDIIFADPPYDCVSECMALLDTVDAGRLLGIDSWLVIEHGFKTTLPILVAGAAFQRRYRYGDTALSLFSSSIPTSS
jgi:16S rRNA (guanine966-N2)-methyltransferase